MLNSTEHEISTAHKNYNAEKYRFFLLSLAEFAFIMLINIKMSSTVGILTLMSMLNFILSLIELEKEL